MFQLMLRCSYRLKRKGQANGDENRFAQIESRLAIADTVRVMAEVLKLRAAKEVPFLRQCHVAGGAYKTAYQHISFRAGAGIASGSRAHANVFIKSHSFVVSKVASDRRQADPATQS